MKEGPITAPKLKTWSFLSSQRRKPSEYEVVSADIHFMNNHTQPGKTTPAFPSLNPTEPFNRWYDRNLNGCLLRHDDWHAFRDPDEITYRLYNIVQDGHEHYVEEVLDRFNGEGHDSGLSAPWLKALAKLYTPARFVHHAVQMASNYASTVTPTSTIAICSAFQAADALRWVSNTSYRTAELALHQPGYGFAQDERKHWENAPEWVGFRELMERCLTIYEWGETITVLNLVAKPAIDETCVRQLGRSARRNSDMVLDLLSDAALKDSARARNWTGALVKFLDQKPGNLDHLRGWIAKWEPLADRAIDAYCAALPDAPGAGEEAKQATREFRKSLGL